MRVWAGKEVLKMWVFKLERQDLGKEAFIEIIDIDSSNIKEKDKLNKWKSRTTFIQS